jgi:Transcription elongation factor, GreA/GreB, C-term
MTNPPTASKRRQVWVLWDDHRDRPRGKTHALDCHMIDTFHWVKDQYQRVDVDQIPDHVERCGFCGGGTPSPATRDPVSNTEACELRSAATRCRGEIEIGSTVRARETEAGRTRTWTLVTRNEADPQTGKLSAESPIGIALRGRDTGDRVVVRTPRGQRTYIVEAVSR